MWTFDPINMIFAGLVTGLVFGFLLQRAHVTRYQVILGQFLLKDFTVLKVMLTAIVVGGIGIYALIQMGAAELNVKAATLAAAGIGGLIFGVGMAVLGYCPGTGFAAVAEGSRHAIAGVVGMIVGAGIYAFLYPFLQNNLLKAATVAVGENTKVTLADLTGISPWIFLAVLAAGLVVMYLLLRNRTANTLNADQGSKPETTTPARPA